MPLARFENLDDALKARILSAAEAEFVRHGYEDASLARIASAAGISKGTLYYYFADRDDLYATVVLRLLHALGGEDLLAAFAPRRPEEFWPAISSLFHAGVELARRHPAQMRALRSFHVSLRRNPRPAFEPVMELLAAHLRSMVQTGQRLGCVRTDLGVELLVELLQAADEVLDREAYRAAGDGDAAALERHAALAVDTYRRLLEPPRTSPRRTTRRRARR